MIIRTVLAAGAIAVACGSDACAANKTRIALDLGTVVGSETDCGFTFSQNAIEAFIAKHVDPTDMEFMSTMNGAAGAIRYEIKEFSASQRTAHCAQVGRVAKANGFLRQ